MRLFYSNGCVANALVIP